MILKQVTKTLQAHRKSLSQLGVRSLAVFGSVARSEASSKSDIDILIDFDAKKGLFAFMDVKNYLEELLDCKVDLATKDSIHLVLKARILREAKPVF